MHKINKISNLKTKYFILKVRYVISFILLKIDIIKSSLHRYGKPFFLLINFILLKGSILSFNFIY